MALLNKLLNHMAKRQLAHINFFTNHPHEAQDKILQNLIAKAKHTAFGKLHDFSSIRHADDFSTRVPLSTYESLLPYIKRVMQGEQNVLWPSPIKWFAKSSGTTSTRSKYIPVSPESLHHCHFKAGKDMLALYINECPQTRLFLGKSLAIGGSHDANEYNTSFASRYGDISAVVIQNLPFWAQYIRTPTLNVALMDNWEEKIDKMARLVAKANVSNIAGVPTWVAVLLERILTHEKKENLLEVWPNLEVFFHGAVAFAPYKKLFHAFFPSNAMTYWDVYNASEGFFGVQRSRSQQDLLLLLDHGIFYEFLPLDRTTPIEESKALKINEVELGKDYALVISTNAGLWRYHIGDTIRFTSLSPYLIRISGRTKHYLNTFGEEVIVENAENAIAKACEKTEAIIENFSAAPIFIEKGKPGGHEWVIEFRKEPSDMNHFTTLLDESLRAINSDYDAKRSFDIALVMPKIHSVPPGTFYQWLKKQGKLGAQHKVPRLSNSRTYVESLLAML